MLSIEKPKLESGSSTEIKKLHALLCQAQVDLNQLKAFHKNKNMFLYHFHGIKHLKTSGDQA